MIKSYLSRRENIILTAIEIINELGTPGLTIREISNRQEVTEAAIYKHFNSKLEIILGVLDKFSQFDSKIASVIEEQNMAPKEGIAFIAKSYAEYYQGYPALTAVLFIYDSIQSEGEAAERMKEILNNRYAFIGNLVTAGQAEGRIDSNIKSEDFSSSIIGMMESIIFKWRIKNYGFPLKETIIRSVDMILSRF